jgi:hypothetical protein
MSIWSSLLTMRTMLLLNFIVLAKTALRPQLAKRSGELLRTGASCAACPLWAVAERLA